RHILDDDHGEDLLANVGAAAPPLGVDDGRNDRQEATPNDRPHRLGRSGLAPLERNQHPRVEREGHAPRRRRASFGAPPRHSAAIRASAASSSGGTPYFSKKASAAANFASLDAISARSAETLPL